METLLSARLVAPDSPKRAFYHIRLLRHSDGHIVVRKESGTSSEVWRVLDAREWNFYTDETMARKFYSAKIRSKIFGNRPRQYKEVEGLF